MARLKFNESAELERTVASVLLKVMEDVSPCPVLVIDDLDGHLEDGLKAAGFAVTRWCRWKVGERSAGAWPGQPEVPFGLVLMRLPRIKDAFEMALHAAASVMAPDGVLYVAGANDEGIKSSTTLISTVFADAQTVDTRKHCRVVAARKPMTDDLRQKLRKWERDMDGWMSYPGVFAKGNVDDATALLIETLPGKILGSVLDFGCGGGVIAHAALRRGATITMLDADAIALEAAKQNVDPATAILSDGFREITGKFDLILSNPPIHRGSKEDYTVLRDLLEKAPDYLTKTGHLVFVVQRTVPLKDMGARFAKIEEIAGDTRFKVLKCSLKSD
jgi:16S rRNA (guanine1207-N2)-methyltransferase